MIRNINTRLALFLFTFSTPIISGTHSTKKGEEFDGFIKKANHSGHACGHSSLPLGTIVEIRAEKPPEIKVERQKMGKPATSAKLSSKFGKRKCRKCSPNHKGVDYKGKKVIAALDGEVSKVGWGGGFGKLVVLDHKDANGKVKKTTLYGHMRRCDVKNGQKVKKGQVLGRVGSTGRSNGSHVHFEVSNNTRGGYDGHLNGKKENPLPYIEGKKEIKVVTVKEKPVKKSTCTIRERVPYGEEIIEVPKTVAKKVGMENKNLMQVAVKVMALPKSG